MKKVVIVSAHPDDEALGVGGTLLKYKKQGYLIYWIIATHVFESQGYSKSIIESSIRPSYFLESPLLTNIPQSLGLYFKLMIYIIMIKFIHSQ